MGGFPGGGAPLRLPMIVGYARTIEMLCTARAVPAGEAKDYGLVLDVFPDEGFLDEVVQRAQYMATKGPIGLRGTKRVAKVRQAPGRSEEHTSELQSLMRISYAVFCLKKKTKKLKQSRLTEI